MASSKKSSRSVLSTKKPAIRRIKTYNFFLILAVLFGMIAGVLLVKLLYRGEPVSSVSQVQLGSYQYEFKDGKATKLNDEKTTSLRTFLEAQVKNSGCSADGPDVERVVTFTKDRSQVLLDYGCYGGGAHMFAVLKDGAWQAISPTNHFEIQYGLPECSHVDSNGISKEIAPVCYQTHDADITYTVR